MQTFVVYHPKAGIWISYNRSPADKYKGSFSWLMIPPATWGCE